MRIIVTRSLRVRSVLSFSLSCLSFFLFYLGRGQGELPRATGGLGEVAVDGEQERTAYNIVMIQ